MQYTYYTYIYIYIYTYIRTYIHTYQVSGKHRTEVTFGRGGLSVCPLRGLYKGP